MGEPADWSKRLFVPTTNKFEKAYPELEDAIIEWIQKGKGVNRFQIPGKKDQKIKSRISVKSYGPLIRCSNALCFRGGFQLGLIIHEMIRKKEMEREGFMMCEGDEGSPKGRRRGRRCVNSINYKIVLKYKNNS